jgi:DNA-binding transcriptional ArsR family regulator
MSSIDQVPDYDLEDIRIVSSPQELRAMADPLRTTILDLLLERAATVGELAAAVARPKSTVAHHVGVLVEAKMLKVVRARRVRAIDERFYGRTARIFYVGAIRPEQARELGNYLSVAAAESAPALEADDLRAVIRHARIPRERAAEFWERVVAVTHEFMRLPRSGETVFGFVAGLYPTEYPTLPEPDDTPGRRPRDAGGAGGTRRGRSVE